jgi:hypothetical protein
MSPYRGHYVNKFNYDCAKIINNYTKGNIPLNKNVNFVLKYQGCEGIRLGTGLIETGFLMAFFFKPIKDPIITNGAEQQIHKTRRESRVVKDTAADEPSIVRSMLIIINTVNASEG